ncbi:MAG: DUF6088 family protein [Marinilabiliaceae bacterium]|nr:DUF6088 family protein [Bacteroidales bacterium]MDD5814916.1 DUF6088 family protein [Bacteroidales bacterium]MDY4520018.1 DUF6088 family protein [Bacteroidales bacterium]
MSTIEDKIVSSIRKCGRGHVFYPDTFASYSSSDNIRKALMILKSKGIIINVARGIYCYPKIDKQLGLGVILPSVDEIVEAVAKRDHIKVVPTGAHAQNILGLSTQVPMNYVYLTNGWAKELTVLNNINVKFKQTSAKSMSFHNKLAMLITVALKDFGQKNVTSEHIDTIHRLLRNEPKEKVMKDLVLMPVWIRKIVVSGYEDK